MVYVYILTNESKLEIVNLNSCALVAKRAVPKMGPYSRYCQFVWQGKTLKLLEIS